MKSLFGILMILAGVVFGLYVGVYVMFIGGIIGIVNVVNGMIEGAGVEGALLGWSIVKILFSSLVGTIASYVLILPGVALFSKS